MYSVVIRISTLETYYSGGLKAYAEACPNESFCSDGEICRVGFMSWADVEGFVKSVEATGLSPELGAVAVIREDKGLIHSCDWLEFERIDGTPAARLFGSTSDFLATPPNWLPGNKNELTTEAEIQEDWDRIDVKDGVETYRHRRTGEIRHIGRIRVPAGQRRWCAFGSDA
jgi:hypothetical protein